MAEGDAEPQHPYKRFRGDYGQSDEEQQSNPLDDEVESVNEHRSPQQPTDQIYLPDSMVQHPLRFPDNRTDEGYLVLPDSEAEETVKSKPRARRATAKRRPSETTTTTTDDSSSDAGVTMDSQSKPRQRSSKRSRTPDNGTGDDDTGSETSVVVKPSAGGL